jgi:hypothetical protein
VLFLQTGTLETQQEQSIVETGGFGLILILILGALVIAAVVFVMTKFSGGRGAQGAASAPPPVPPVASGPPRLRDRLDALHKAGQWPELLRLLDRTMPEWIVAGSLIETARELSALETGIARARSMGVTDEVTGRLTQQVQTVSTDLWSLADRIAAADQIGSAAPREALERQDEALVRLRGGIREAREGLAQLSLTGVAGAEGLRASEGRFRSLAATARELHEWEREQVPW